MTETTERSQVHATFTLERTYPVPVERVWTAFADLEAKRAWFGAEHPDLTMDAFDDDFRVGGHGISDGRFGDGPMSRFLSTYTDIVEQQRIVYVYDMWFDDAHISTSLTTVTLEPVEEGTLLTFVEHGVHLDGHDTAEGREEGTGEILDALGRSLVA
jgi:uncharacterized protein YndB with AHSA1/START domain